MSKRTALWISLSVIVLYCAYQLATPAANTDIPATFFEMVARILRTKLLVFGAILLLLRLEGEGLRQLGWSRDRWPRHVAIGIAFGIAMFVAFNVVLDSILSSLVPRPAPGGRSVLAFFASPMNLLAWIPIGIFGGGVVEELQRIFIITRFEKAFGRTSLVVGVALSSAMFGYGHLYQGLAAAISTAVSGLAFSLLYLRRRSALEPITAHAVSDVLAMLAATLLARR